MFKYRQKVVVTKGFYEGVKGRLVNVMDEGNSYLLKFGFFGRKYAWVKKGSIAVRGKKK